MNLYLVDDTEENVDPEFDAALFVRAETPERAAYLWEQCYGRDAAVARVTFIPSDISTDDSGTEGSVGWGELTQTIVTL